MTNADIWYEFRQIHAFKTEQKTGKPYSSNEDAVIDDSYDDWLEGVMAGRVDKVDNGA